VVDLNELCKNLVDCNKLQAFIDKDKYRLAMGQITSIRIGKQLYNMKNCK
jgi:hypothetical protein